ncbi:MAG: hypothetical protein JKY65_30560, partial [Planctomycetes bacterium]|nr:hypothetical protein [Planctomycetota bacterium]
MSSDDLDTLPGAQLTERLRALPFGDQLDRLEEALDAGTSPGELLVGTARLRDHEPLAVVVRRLAQRGLLAASQGILTQLLGELPEAGVHRVLRKLEREAVPADQLAGFAQAVAAAERALPLERLAVLCLMDRWLKNAAPDIQRALGEEACAAVRNALEGDALADLSDATLARVPGARVA